MPGTGDAPWRSGPRRPARPPPRVGDAISPTWPTAWNPAKRRKSKGHLCCQPREQGGRRAQAVSPGSHLGVGESLLTADGQQALLRASPRAPIGPSQH